MADEFEFYKPLRNHLRKVGLIESLGVIRAYMQYMQFGATFPRDIEVEAYFLQAPNPVARKMFEWELDTLSQEIILHASEWPAPETLRKWSYLAGAVNKLKDFENNLARLYPKDDTILLELHRIAHRQFPWQRRPNAMWITRYYKIFGDPGLDALIQRTIWLTARELYRIGLVLTGIYLDKFALTYPPHIEIHGLDQAKLDRFLTHFAIDLDALKTKTAEVQQLNENYAYVFNPLRIYPLVWIEDRTRVVAPIPTFLFRRFTEGLYYEIRDEPGFSDAFGGAFQRYVGEVITAANEGEVFRIYPEAEYHVGRARRDTVDWIVEERSGTVFVESKTKRLRLEAKTALTSREALESEMDKLAAFIAQVYRTIRDYRDGRYPQKRYLNEPLLPIVVTLEEWHAFGDLIQREIEQRVEAQLLSDGLPNGWLEEMPYVTCSIDDFESAIQIIARVGVAEVMARRASNPEYKKWEFRAFLSQEFPEEVRSARALFSDVLDALSTGG